MRLFIITFAAILGCYFAGSAIWAFVASNSLPIWAAILLIVTLIAVVFGGVVGLEMLKHDIQDKIHMHQNRSSMPLGIALAALYFGYSEAGVVDNSGLSDSDAFSGGDFGGGDGGGD
ncbi:MAG: hypothetical protein AAFW68_01705 [Pseudomonadota bacterium]